MLVVASSSNGSSNRSSYRSSSNKKEDYDNDTKDFLSAYCYWSGLFYSVFTVTLGNRNYYYPMNKETETQKLCNLFKTTKLVGGKVGFLMGSSNHDC